jgi:hypothetical protein
LLFRLRLHLKAISSLPKVLEHHLLIPADQTPRLRHLHEAVNLLHQHPFDLLATADGIILFFNQN